MCQNHRAKLGPAGRSEVVLLCERGCSFREVAQRLGISVATAHKSRKRHQRASESERASGSWAIDRNSRPHRSPGPTTVEDEQRICRSAWRTNLGPGRSAGIVGCPRSTCMSCWSATGSRDDGVASVRRSNALSGRSQARCCTSTPNAGSASPNRGTGPPATVTAPTVMPATCRRTASLMTTWAWPTSSCTQPTPATRPRPRPRPRRR